VAKREPKELSSLEVLKQTAKLLLVLELTPTPNYTKEEQQAKGEKGIKVKGGWWKLPDQRFCLQCCSSTSGKTTT
jgi:hypothetical protein